MYAPHALVCVRVRGVFQKKNAFSGSWVTSFRLRTDLVCIRLFGLHVDLSFVAREDIYIFRDLKKPTGPC